MDAYERSRYILKYTAHIAVLYTFSGSHYFSSSPALFRLHFRSTLQFFFPSGCLLHFPVKTKRKPMEACCRCWLINLLKQIFTTFSSRRRVVLWHYRCINQAIWWLQAGTPANAISLKQITTIIICTSSRTHKYCAQSQQRGFIMHKEHLKDVWMGLVSGKPLLRDESSTRWPSRCLAMHIKTGACIYIFPNDLAKW